MEKQNDSYLYPNPAPISHYTFKNYNRYITAQLLCIYVTADPVRTARDSVAVSAVF